MAKTKKQKHIEAEARQELYDKLSTKDKVRRAEQARGHSAKQLGRLAKQLAVEQRKSNTG